MIIRECYACRPKMASGSLAFGSKCDPLQLSLVTHPLHFSIHVFFLSMSSFVISPIISNNTSIIK
jgi:hypothetical protein